MLIFKNVSPPTKVRLNLLCIHVDCCILLNQDQSNGKPLFVQHSKHIHPHTHLYMKELQMKIPLHFHCGMLKHKKFL